MMIALRYISRDLASTHINYVYPPLASPSQVSGLDYAIMSGGDVAPLGEEAVSQLHALFKVFTIISCFALVLNVISN